MGSKSKEINQAEYKSVNTDSSSKISSGDPKNLNKAISTEIKIPNSPNVGSSSKSLEQSSSIKIIEVIQSLCDTSQFFKIYKHTVKDSAIKSIEELGLSSLKLISIYGISSVMKNFLNQVFEEEIQQFPKSEGIYLFFSKSKEIGVFAFITPNEDLYSTKPISSSNKFVVIIRVLTDLSRIIVACMSDEIIGNWYFENNGRLNPFRPKIHKSGGGQLVSEYVQDSKLVNVLVETCQGQHELFNAPNDNFNLLFTVELHLLAKQKNSPALEKLKEIPAELLKFNDYNSAKIKLPELFRIINIGSDLQDAQEKLNKLVENLISKKKRLTDFIASRLLNELQYKFNFDNSIVESEIRKLLTTRFVSVEDMVNEFLNKLEKIFKYSQNSIFFIHARKYYDQYEKSFKNEESVKGQELFNTVKNLFIDVGEKFKYSKYRNCYWRYSKRNVMESIHDMALNLKYKCLMTQQEFENYCEEEFFSLIDSPHTQMLKRVLLKPVTEFVELLNNLEKDFQAKCKSIIKSETKDIYELVLKKSEFSIKKVGMESECQPICSIESVQELLSSYIKGTKVNISQIIGLEKDVFFVFISDSEKSVTHVIRFNPMLETRDNFEVCSDIPDPEARLAWGSSCNKYILFQNTHKKVTHSCLETNKYLKEGITIDVYSKVEKVVNSYYMKKARILFVLDEAGLLYKKELVRNDCKVVVVKPPGEYCEPLRPLNGKKFHSIDVSDDEMIIFLQTEDSIETYKDDFTHVHSISIAGQFLSFKNITFNKECYLLTQDKDYTMKCIKVVVPKQETYIKSTEKAEKIIYGNPIFDIHHLGLIKFGPLVKETQIIKGSRALGYYSSCNNTENVSKYLQNLAQVRENFKYLGNTNPSTIFKDVKLIESSNLIYAIRTRMPLHIASIQNGNLIPLQNGFNNFEEFTMSTMKESFLDSLTEYIKFGIYEEILKNIKNMLVVAIIGKQSSGKSYLLNRLAGTRFDVAAERCTDGIWMGIGHIQNTPIIVFDCEGLFTVERNLKEEIKLCLFISSLSDIVILNTDLSSGKHIKGLFDEFALGVDRLKGKNLFKGTLDITYRDIPDNQEAGAEKEFNNFLNVLLEAGKKETLLKLFNGYTMNSQYHNFESELFNEEVEITRKKYLEVKRKWPDDTNFGLMMKIVLMQIYNDDTESLDIKVFSIMRKKVNKRIDEIIEDAEKARKYLGDGKYEGKIDMKSSVINFSWLVKEFYANESRPLTYFQESLSSEKNDNLISKSHNCFYSEFNFHIQEFLKFRKSMIIDYFLGKMPKTHEFKIQIELDIDRIGKILDKYSSSLKLCLKNCENCKFHCIQLDSHSGNCNCGTDHICKEFCDFCIEKSCCSLQNGHKKKDVCNPVVHKCNKNCQIENCSKTCSNYINHKGCCKCSSPHPCKEKCGMYEKCGEFCKIEITTKHDIHDCNKKCLFKCIFEDGQECSSLNHFHDKELEEVDIEGIGKRKKHLCMKTHSCLRECEALGVCEIKSIGVNKEYRNKYNSFEYEYVEISTKKLSCKDILDPNEVKHESIDHICSSAKHYCEARCPDCNCLCEKPYGHNGLHLSNSHRNKENCEYISIAESFSKKIFDLRGERIAKFDAGESAVPETCYSYCAAKDRGHSHLIPCMGGNLCKQITKEGYAVHSTQAYKSSNKNQQHYDLVTCDTYWREYGWVSPHAKNEDLQKLRELFNKCSFSCDHPSHNNSALKIYCESYKFHSTSQVYSDHLFYCPHPDVNEYNIIFIVEGSNSMSSHFAVVQSTIKSLIEKWKLSSKFGIVTYSDHSPNNGALPSDKPVSVYPSTSSLKDSDSACATRYINDMKLTGGGNNNGKAMVDGLVAAYNIEILDNRSSIFIVFANDAPHGKEFGSTSTFSNGCPCRFNIKEVVMNMKDKGIDFVLVKLSNALNSTADEFRKIYGQRFSVMDLNEVLHYQIRIVNSAAQDVENDFVISRVLVGN